MAFALVQNKAGTAIGPGPSVTFTSTPNAGNLELIVLITDDATPATTFVDPSGWSRRVSFTEAGGAGSLLAWDRVVPSGASKTVTVSSGSTSTSWEMEIMEFSGVDQATVFDQAVTNAGTGATVTSIQPGSLTPTVTSELLITAGGPPSTTNGGTEAVDSSFNILDAATFAKVLVGYKIKTDATAENPTLSWATARRALAAQLAYVPQTVFLRDRHYPRGVERGAIRGVA